MNFNSKEKAYERYEQAVSLHAQIGHSIPHCDSMVLHAPETCEFCDLCPDLHESRKMNEIDYTGQPGVRKHGCPAESKRPLEIINRWPGNVRRSATHT